MNFDIKSWILLTGLTDTHRFSEKNGVSLAVVKAQKNAG